MDAECVDIGLEEVVQRIINHLVAPEPAGSIESGRYDRDVEMTLTVLCPLVAHVQVRLVLHQEFHWSEGLLQALPDLRLPAHAHGSTRRKGFTATRA